MNFDATRSSYFDGSFDYRTLIPSSLTSGSQQQQQQQQTSYVAVEQDVESNSSFTGSSSAATAISGCTEMCGGWLPEMSWRERLIGCATCMVAGYLLSLGSFFRIRDLLFGNPVPLVLNATVGNLIALAGSCFLSGPTNQYNRMWTSKRRTATIMYLGSLLLTIVVLIIPLPGPKGLILLLLMLSQYVSITWYCLSYIPMAQGIVAGYLRRWVSSAVGGDDGEF